MTDQTTTHDAQHVSRGQVLDALAVGIAESRYLAWDGHAKGTAPMTWDEYVAADPDVAEGIYLEDGRRDAEFLAPLVDHIIQGAIAGGFLVAAETYDQMDDAAHMELLAAAQEAEMNPVVLFLLHLADLHVGSCTCDCTCDTPAT